MYSVIFFVEKGVLQGLWLAGGIKLALISRTKIFRSAGDRSLRVPILKPTIDIEIAVSPFNFIIAIKDEYKPQLFSGL